VLASLPSAGLLARNAAIICGTVIPCRMSSHTSLPLWMAASGLANEMPRSFSAWRPAPKPSPVRSEASRRPSALAAR
jgi:hypothetical protein